MANLGSFVFGLLAGGGGGGPMTIAVPGNAASVVARGTEVGVTVVSVDPNTVELVLPTEMTYVALQELLNELTYVFGSASGSELGWLTVTAKGILGMADSSDADAAPDYVPVAGIVTLTPSLSRPVRLLASGQFLAVSPIVATFDSDGELSLDGVKNVRIIAPQWTGLSRTDWRWSFEVRPGPGQSWSGFSGSFTGVRGALINLASFIDA